MNEVKLLDLLIKWFSFVRGYVFVFIFFVKLSLLIFGFYLVVIDCCKEFIDVNFLCN